MERPQQHPVLSPLRTVSHSNGLAPLSDRLREIEAWLGDDLRRLDASIAGLVNDLRRPDGPGEARRAAGHLLGRPGKRVRPLCVLLGARVGGRNLDPVVRELALASELIHAATLLHDDVLDVGEVRRGAPAARILFGNSVSILAGDHLLVHALQRIAGCGFSCLLADVLRVIDEMVRAEALQLARRNQIPEDLAVARQTYLDVVHGKTASLFRWSLEAGATASGLDAATVAVLGQVGLHIGTAFQVVDDLLDIRGQPQLMGKGAWVDLREGKLTWPLLLTLERCPELHRELCDDPKKLVEAQTSLRQHVVACRADEGTAAFAQELATTARMELRQLPAGQARTALTALVDTIVSRVR